MPNSDSLRAEARVFGRLVLGWVPEDEFIERYVVSHEYLFREPARRNDDAIVSLGVRRPWLLPSLDSAAALLQPNALVHRKALLMAAILEASPRYVDEFLPRRTTWAGLAWVGVRSGVVTALRLIVGIPTLMWLGKRA